MYHLVVVTKKKYHLVVNHVGLTFFPLFNWSVMNFLMLHLYHVVVDFFRLWQFRLSSLIFIGGALPSGSVSHSSNHNHQNVVHDVCVDHVAIFETVLWLTQKPNQKCLYNINAAAALLPYNKLFIFLKK